jgi:hypothetical protein
MRNLDSEKQGAESSFQKFLLFNKLHRNGSEGPLLKLFSEKNFKIPSDQSVTEKKRNYGSEAEKNSEGNLGLKIPFLLADNNNTSDDGSGKGADKN